MTKMLADGTLHTLGREVFYYEATLAPVSARQSRKRAKEWRRLLERVG